MTLSGKPIVLDKDTWYYEETRGINIVAWRAGTNGHRVAHHVRISWPKLRKSLANKDYKKVSKP